MMMYCTALAPECMRRPKTHKKSFSATLYFYFGLKEQKLFEILLIKVFQKRQFHLRGGDSVISKVTLLLQEPFPTGLTARTLAV